MESEGEGGTEGVPSPVGRIIHKIRKAGNFLATTALPTDLVDVIASEMSIGVERAVECWMSEIEQALTDIHLTSLGRLNAVCEILNEYKHLTGKTQLKDRSIC
jgi:hypothetical protein